ncbi:MAG: undecaprenyldiphospho-muramoylpentapeptide beta-N-acetylglucosaminyltransferase [bacterium]|nr:MAG: undecaprenyldiphospho-muramoylpentapeptide beta-N-acetylglucosaminyltransferase [bacterium]
MEMKMVCAGGGTGGHIYPALSVADVLTSRFPDLKTLFVGTKSGLESSVVPEAGYEIEFIVARGVRGRGYLGKALTLASVCIGFIQALLILLRFKPGLVFGSGGYASASVVMAASLLRRKVVLQEQNSVPGLTNRLLAPRAERVYLGFEKAAGYLRDHPGVRVTGNPLRSVLLEPCPGEPRKAFGLGDEMPVLLVFGGSQGARNLNRAAVDYLLRHERVQAILQTGTGDYTWVRTEMEQCADRVYVSPYISEIHLAYGAADVALARAGALSVSELAAVGLPAILVPYPYAADDHQAHNATLLVEAGGALVIEDDRLDGGTLGDVLDPLLADTGRLERMRNALEAVASREAAGRIADDIQHLCGWGADATKAGGGS